MPGSRMFTTVLTLKAPFKEHWYSVSLTLKETNHSVFELEAIGIVIQYCTHISKGYKENTSKIMNVFTAPCCTNIYFAWFVV